jgi:hypothetical protein
MRTGGPYRAGSIWESALTLIDVTDEINGS